MSLPLRKCGLKSESKSNRTKQDGVTSLAEVWIEICSDPVLHTDESSSLPLRKCGLK